MTVSNSWLVNISLGINTTVIQTENFNAVMLLGVMPTQTSPYQCPPTSWGTDPFKVYASASDFNTEFDPIIAAAKTAGDVTQINRFVWLQNAVTAYFAQNNSGLTVTVMKMDVPTSSTNYSTLLANLATANNNWYGFTICDNIPVLPSPPSSSNVSKLDVAITVSTGVTIRAGTVITFSSAAPTSPYVLAADVTFIDGGEKTGSFYSLDFTTPIPVNNVSTITYNSIAPTGLVSATNPGASTPLALTISTVVVKATATGAGTVPAGSECKNGAGPDPTSPYLTLDKFVVTGAGSNSITCYSLDVTTVIPINAVTDFGIDDANFAFFNYPVGNPAANTVIIPSGGSTVPGILTPVTGVVAGLSNLRGATLNNPKVLFLDSNDPTVAAQIQASKIGTEDLLTCYHSLNLQPYTATVSESLSAAALSHYFSDIFAPGVGSKALSSMQLQGVGADPTITTANIGTPGTDGNSSNLIGWNNNVYASFGNSTGPGLMQYGYMSNSTSSSQVYLDEIVGSDFLRLTAQADLVTYIISQQPFGGVLYNDFGIQQIVSIFKTSVQKAVAQNIVQPPSNSNFVYQSYAQVPTQNIANRLYNGLVFNGKFLSRIQQIAVKINLSL